MQRRFQLVGDVRGKLLPDERGAFDLGAVAAELRLLRGDAPQQRLDLAVLVPFIILHRIVRVNGVDRRDDLFCQPRGKEERERQRQQRHKTDRLGKAEHERPERKLHRGETQHAPVRETLRGVKLPVGERGGVAPRFARAGFERLPDLLALEMVFHAGGVRLVIEKDRAVRGDPRDPAVAGQPVQIVRAGERHALRGKRRFGVELLHLHAGEIVVGYAHDKDERREKHRERRAPDGGENFLHFIADAAHRFDESAALGELCAQRADVDVHGARLACILHAPDAGKQRFAGKDLPDVFHKELQKLVFLECERNAPLIHRYGVAALVKRDAAAGKALRRPGRGAAQHGADARDHLHHAEGLGKIIVRAGIQPDDLVILAAAGGRKDDGELRRERGGAQLFQYFNAVLAGQHDVEQDKLRRLRTHRLPERLASGEALRFKAGGTQRIQHQLADAGIVLHTIDHTDAPFNRRYHTILNVKRETPEM